MSQKCPVCYLYQCACVIKFTEAAPQSNPIGPQALDLETIKAKMELDKNCDCPDCRDKREMVAEIERMRAAQPTPVPPVPHAIPHPGKADRWICANCSCDIFAARGWACPNCKLGTTSKCPHCGGISPHGAYHNCQAPVPPGVREAVDALIDASIEFNQRHCSWDARKKMDAAKATLLAAIVHPPALPTKGET